MCGADLCEYCGYGNASLSLTCTNSKSGSIGWDGLNTTSSPSVLTFDGADDYLILNDTYDPTAYTLEVWIKFPSLINSTIVTRANNLASNTGKFANLLRLVDGKIEHLITAENSLYKGSFEDKVIKGTTVITPNKWYHIVATAKSGDKARLFINGIEEGTSLTTGQLWTDGDKYLVGVDNNSGSTESFLKV